MSLRSEVVRIFNELLGQGKKITELPDADLPLTGNEYVEIIQDGINKKVQVSQFQGGSTLGVIEWDMTLNTIPTTGENGQRYYGTGSTTLTTGTGGVIPLECLFTQIVNSPANNTDTSAFVFQYII